MQAQLITGLVQSSISDELIVTDSLSFDFINKNWDLDFSTSEMYLVVNKIKTFDVIFSDEENDNIIMKAVDSAGLGVYIKMMNSSCFQIYLNCDDESLKSKTLVFSYTDAYHTNAIYWNKFSVNINIF